MKLRAFYQSPLHDKSSEMHLLGILATDRKLLYALMKVCLVVWRCLKLTISPIQIKKGQNVHFSGIQSFFFHFIIDSMRTDSIIPPHLLRQDSKQDGRLAQLGEHRPYKARVTGSSPVASTISLYFHTIKNHWFNNFVRITSLRTIVDVHHSFKRKLISPAL